ncbi:MAG: TM0996/MTH895 family glutaredoxin-like protein [gamma proteobacterium symbiont of Lucinoma myriamae]|nr:TM0996/MTH895 family glutaredoxin-like protein [gamma proteobacterium symbiont of Lucinoma myriamae]MCU7818015.1 TM0996/MTH895 family glutaredoxin-like protein [gamma proteobacterium symbiont of Lucinoma myriamae]MCU7833472.1 TM0996/MTH895 family glutaredoxin-like protein [gamma proteobacterium symbiont of Lucinoma myriamae]
MKIQIAGPGCAKCQATEAVIRKVCTEMEVEADIEHLTNPAEFAKLGVMFTPAVVLEGKVVESGHVPSEEKVRELISQHKA